MQTRLTAFLLFTYTCIGAAQTCDPALKVPKNLEDMTAKLGLCAEIGEIANPEIAPAAPPSALNLPKELILPSDSARFRAQAKLNMSVAQLSSASALLSEVVLKKSANTFPAQTKLQIATSIIGLVGGALGGGLHLVNNPQVGHAATLVGIGGGAAGAGLAIYSAIKYRAHDCQVPTFPESKQSIIGAQELKSICRNPQIVAAILQRMAVKLESIQDCVLDPNTCRTEPSQ